MTDPHRNASPGDSPYPSGPSPHQNYYSPGYPYQEYAAQYPAYYPGLPPSQEKQTSTMAIVALVLAHSALVTCPFGVVFGPIGAILGHVARRKIRDTPGLSGDGLAKTGIIVGWATTGLYAALIAWVFIAEFVLKS